VLHFDGTELISQTETE